MAGQPHGRVHDDAGHGSGRRLVIEPLHFHITKTVEREAGFQRLFARAGEVEEVGGGGPAEIDRVERAVGIEHLAVTDGDPLPRLAVDSQPGPADHVLSQVEDVPARPRLRDLDRRQFLVPPQGLGRGRLDGNLLRITGTDIHGLPRVFVEAGPVPAVHPHSGVVLAAQQQIGVANRARGGLPTAVADDGLRAAVGQLYDKLHEQSRVAAVVFPLTGERQIAGVPAVAKHGADGVLAALEELRHVVGLIIDSLAILAPARCQFILAHALAVQVQLIAAQGRDVQVGA